MPGVVALRHRNFRLLWFGQLVSTTGDQMQMVAIGWQMYHLTNSVAALGLVALFRSVPFMTLALVGGVIADSMDRRRLMVVTQTLQMAVAVFLVATTVAGVAGAWSIYVAAFAGGALSAFDGPARQALIPNIVPNEDIANALTLNTLIRQSATIVGPGIGGFCIAFLGPGTTYGINALTFLAVIGANVVFRRSVQRHWRGPVGHTGATAHTGPPERADHRAVRDAVGRGTPIRADGDRVARLNLGTGSRGAVQRPRRGVGRRRVHRVCSHPPPPGRPPHDRFGHRNRTNPLSNGPISPSPGQ